MWASESTGVCRIVTSSPPELATCLVRPTTAGSGSDAELPGRVGTASTAANLEWKMRFNQMDHYEDTTRYDDTRTRTMLHTARRRVASCETRSHSRTDIWQAQMDMVMERNDATIAAMLKARRPAT